MYSDQFDRINFDDTSAARQPARDLMSRREGTCLKFLQRRRATDDAVNDP